ncbi:MAG: AAA family ATPase [Planctomycetales bacterium]|nr:AAA family ATPase [Planctomycetales bacterium]
MKILRLDLVAYGPFTGETLDFSPGQFGLHLVYGPNEAGKSTTLRALRRLFYGIPTHCEDDFLHPAGDLRIGAKLSTKDELLECIRRRGSKSTKGVLRAADDETPLESSRLDEMLAGLDEGAFRSRFGIDYKELIKGGKEVCEGKGDLGQLLFAAASGVADLGNVLKALDDDAGELFKPAGRSNPLINKAAAELKEVKKRLDKSELSVKSWKTKQDELEVAEEKCRELQAELTRQTAARKRIESYCLVQSDLSKRKQLLKEQSELMGVPLLPKEFSQRRQQAQDELIKFRTQAEAAERELVEIADDLQAITLPVELLAEQNGIDQALGEFAAYQRDLGDRITLAAQHQGLLRDAGTLRTELAVKDPESLRLRRVERLRIQKLAAESQSRLVQLENCRKTLAKIDAEITRLTPATTQTSPLRDPDALKRTIKRAQPKAELETQIERLEAELKQSQRQFAVGLGRLGLWTGNGEALAALALPPLEAVESADAELRTITGERNGLAKELEQVTRQLADLAIEIDSRRRVGQVLTLEDLEQARAKRDNGWSLIKRLWLTKDAAEADVRKFIAEFPPATDSAAAFEASVQQADATSDRMRREAEKVAELDGLQTQERKLASRKGQLAEQISVLQHQLVEQEVRWHELWRPLGISPQSPAEMRGWLTRAGELARQAEAIAVKQVEVAQLRQTAETLRQDLHSALAEFGEPTLLADEPLAHMIDRADQLAERSLRSMQERKLSQKQLLSEQEKRQDAQRELESAQAALSQWQVEWKEAVSPLGLREKASPEEVSELLTLSDDYFKKLTEAKGIQERMAGIDARAEHFVSTLTALAARVAADIANLKAPEMAGELRKRLEAARKLEVRKSQLEEQQRELQTRRDEAQRQLRTLQEQLAAMCAEALCKQPEELAGVERKAERKRELDGHLHELHDRLYQHCQSQPLDDFISAALAQSADYWDDQGQKLDGTLKELQNKHTEEVKAAQNARNELKLMDGSALAAEAEEEAQQLLAKIRAHAEEYVRLKLAGVLLRKAIERYREKNQGVVLQRASQLFADLTLGSFVALQPDFDDAGKPVLVGVRPGGKHVTADGMSDGTCDQLYLALRLASLETYVREHQPIPFIVDDILINFDDDRAAAALKALAQLARHTQVIFFTHHEHLLALSEEHLERGELFTHRLPGRTTADAALTEQTPATVG